PPSVVSTTPASNALGVPAGATVTATFDRSVVASSIQFTLKDPSNQSVAGTTSYNNTTFAASFKPTAALAAGATYTATISGATNQSGVAMAAPYSWSFTVASGCPCTLFPASATPDVANVQDASAVEVGMKFTADVAGNVTGVRFYKGTSNIGTHIGDLWS